MVPRHEEMIQSVLGFNGKRKLNLDAERSIQGMYDEFTSYRDSIIAEVKTGQYAPKVTEDDIVY